MQPTSRIEKSVSPLPSRSRERHSIIREVRTSSTHPETIDSQRDIHPSVRSKSHRYPHTDRSSLARHETHQDRHPFVRSESQYCYADNRQSLARHESSANHEISFSLAHYENKSYQEDRDKTAYLRSRYS